MTKEKSTNAVKKAKKSLMKSQIIAIIVLAAIVIGLAVSCGLIFLFTDENIDVYTEVLSYGENGNNETASYYSRAGEKEGEYALYDEDGNKMESFAYERWTCYETKLGTILSLDENGKIQVIAILDASDGETVNTANTALLLYGRTERKNIASLKAFNDNGGYEIYASTVSGTRTFLLRNYEASPINQITLSALLTRCGIFSAQVKLDREEMKKEDEKHADDEGYIPIINADGSINLSIYGLEDTYEVTDPETGEKIQKTTPYFILTETAGNAHKIIIGDLTSDGNHYYVRYENVNTVNPTPERLKQIEKIEKNVYLALKDPTASTGYSADMDLLLSSKSDICSPNIVKPINTSNYYDVRNFTVQRLENGEYRDIVSFTYDDLDDRINTIRQDTVYHFENAEALGLVGYEPDNDRIFDSLFALTSISSVSTPDITQSNSSANYVKTVALVSKKVNDLTAVTKEMIESDPEVQESILALSKYGLLEARYILSYDTPLVLGSASSPIVSQAVFISEKTAANTYYVWSPMYNQIVEVGAQYLDFISWDSFEWVDRDLFHTMITFCDGIRFKSGNDDYFFKLDQDVTVSTKYPLHSKLDSVNMTGGSYDADITTDETGNRDIKISLTAKYTAAGSTDSYTHTDEIYNYSIDAIRNYCREKAGESLTGLTAEEIAEKDAFGKSLTSEKKVNNIIDLTLETVFEGDENDVFPDLKIELTFSYNAGNLSISIRPNYSGTPSATAIYDDKVFSNYYASYLNDQNKAVELSETEKNTVEAFRKSVQRVSTTENSVTVSINGASPVSVDMEQFKALYTELVKVSFYGRADRSDIVGGKVLTADEMAELVAKGDDCTMKVEFYRSVGADLVFRMHDYSATKSFTTINDSGCFYVNITTRKGLMSSAKTVANGGIIKAE